MKKRKTPKNAGKFGTVNAYSERFKVDRRTLKKYLEGIEPHGQDAHGNAVFRLAEVQAAIAAARARPPSAKTRAEIRLLEERLRGLKRENDTEEGNLLPRDKTLALVTVFAATLRQVVLENIEHHLPVRLMGRRFEFCEFLAECQAAAERIIAEVRNRVRSVGGFTLDEIAAYTGRCIEAAKYENEKAKPDAGASQPRLEEPGQATDGNAEAAAPRAGAGTGEDRASATEG